MKNTALSIVKTLQNKGYEAYFAGGCVRDILLNIPHNDVDIATNALPEEIENIFKNTFPIGKHFGVILVKENNHYFEIATFRSDSGNSDGRRPKYVTFTTAKEDALRRDFTINGIFYDPISQKFLDFVHGKSDIEQKIIRFIGSPEQRIHEDYLRILRAVRFKNRFNFSYSAETQNALLQWGNHISNISMDRIQREFIKIIQHSSRKTALQEIFHFKIFEYIIPEFSDMKRTLQPKDHHSEGDVLTHSFLALHTLSDSENIEVYLATLFHDIGKAYTIRHNTEKESQISYPDHEAVGALRAKKILKRLKFSKNIIKKVTWIIHHLSIFNNFFAMKLSTRLHYYDHPFFEDMLTVHTADVSGCVPLGNENIASHKKIVKQIKNIKENCKYAHNSKILPSHKAEFFSGKEIMEITNIPAGKRIGEIKEKLRELQIEGEIKSKQEAKAYIQEYLRTI